VIRIDPATGEQRDYAAFFDVPPCSENPAVQCSQTVSDGASGPDYGTFAADGTMYVTDIDQGLIWRIRRGGGDAQVWFSDPRLESLFGPNGIQFMADGKTLLFVNTASNPSAGNPLTGRLYTLPVQADEGPGPLTQVWESLPLDAPDGLAIARSGNVYVALAGSNQVLLLSPQFTEIARTPPDPISNQNEEIPLDGPGSLAFLGDRVLVSNHSPIAGNPSSWAILDVFAGEEGLPLHYPRIYKPKLKLDVRVKKKRPRSRAAGRRKVRLKAVVTRNLATAEVPVEGVRVMVRKKESKTNASGKATVKIRRLGRRGVTVLAYKNGFETAAVKVSRGPR
jgi:sugar lactone lactonase YvrE